MCHHPSPASLAEDFGEIIIIWPDAHHSWHYLNFMASREEFLQQMWDDVINPSMQEHWIDNLIRESERRPDSPFADLGPALKRLLAAGADRRDLSLIARHSAYEAVFGTLYALGDPGVDDNDIEMMHESLLAADPSGTECRPGSAPEKL